MQLDDRLGEHGLATPEGVRLSPSSFGHPREAGVLAHELFHLWMRGAVPPRELGALPALQPLFSPPETTLEELATDLCARALCERHGLFFEPTYLVPLDATLLHQRTAAALAAARASLRAPGDVSNALRARQALRALCGHELAALALADREGAVLWPAPVWAKVAALSRQAGLALADLHAPQLLLGVCRHVRAHRYDDRRRGPLWQGTSPLELPGRLLEQRLAAGHSETRSAVVTHLEAMVERLSFLSP